MDPFDPSSIDPIDIAMRAAAETDNRRRDLAKRSAPPASWPDASERRLFWVVVGLYLLAAVLFIGARYVRF